MLQPIGSLCITTLRCASPSGGVSSWGAWGLEDHCNNFQNGIRLEKPGHSDVGILHRVGLGHARDGPSRSVAQRTHGTRANNALFRSRAARSGFRRLQAACTDTDPKGRTARILFCNLRFRSSATSGRQEGANQKSQQTLCRQLRRDSIIHV